MRTRFLLSWSAALFCALTFSVHLAVGQQPLDGVHTLGSVLAAAPLPNGIRIETSSGGAEQIVALRDNVLRVRVSAGHALPEDASWAVLPQTHNAAVAVQPEDSSDSVGFRTSSLQVAVRRSDLRLTVRDSNGQMVLEDAAPLRFDGSAFRISESMPADEHYFGLGDKTGPLDRRGQTYTMWNTDAYRYPGIHRSALQSDSVFHDLSRRPRRRSLPR